MTRQVWGCTPLQQAYDTTAEATNTHPVAPAGKHIVAVLRILQMVLEKKPSTFADGTNRAALVAHVVLLLGKLQEHRGCAMVASKHAM